MFYIGIIGCGNIGKRYLSALMNNVKNINFNIYVQDLFEKNMNDAKNIILDANKNNNSNHNILDVMPYEMDIVAVPTCSSVRAKIINELLKNHKIKFMILEKFLFPYVHEYDINFGDTKVWVNCPRRCYAHWRYLNDKINRNDAYLYVYGSNFNMCSNAIHFIDLFGFLTKNHNIELSLKNINIIESNRQSYNEMNGCIYNNNLCIISDSMNSRNFVKILFDSQNCFIIVNTPEYIILIEKPSNKILKFKQIYISTSMHNIFLDILFNNDCILTPYEESKKYHINFLKTISHLGLVVT